MSRRALGRGLARLPDLLGALVGVVALTGSAVVSSGPPAEPAPVQPTARRVVLVSIDGLNPEALRRLGRDGAPSFHRLLAEGASTLNARTEREQTETLPNHVGMVTGLPIAASRGGHGVTWNDERRRPRTVHAAAGHRVDSLFAAAERADLTSAVYAGKQKFTLFQRSWRGALDRLTIDDRLSRLVTTARRDLVHREHDVVMVHLALPDATGHARGFMSRAYLRAVSRTDAQLGRLLGAVDASPTGDTWVVLTADHGGAPGARGHVRPGLLANYRIPFVVWGPDVTPGADLYALSRGLRDPGSRRPGYASRRQPVRNGMAANVLTEILGLPRVRRSSLDADGALDWH